ncbi:hypothetical protein [Carboxylicivirga caseinilyticus]|uniref:TolB family protein n=1 Tax=Carboxylicivirga caseinilyticus TaxID=3417572 RepID=UPI003D34A21A|nr:PD40 domain-containing protein [Marinilabiliaceae bacterium A049]
MKLSYLIILSFSLLIGCRQRIQTDKVLPVYPPVYPDYTEVTIPKNIAPLNFMIKDDITAIQAVIKGDQNQMVLNGTNTIRFNLKKWKQLLLDEKKLAVTVSVQKNNEWIQYKSFNWYIADEEIDPYLSYRLIEPGYEVWNKIQLAERCIENFDENIFADNNLTEGSCMNCHIYNNQNPSQSMFHIRGKHGGTVLNNNGNLRKLKTKTDKMLSNAVYGGFHPGGRYAVFSTNYIIPEFHAQGSKKLEVYDTASDLAILDFETNQSITNPLLTDSLNFDTFPVFSADGNKIYYCGAKAIDVPDSIQKLKYSICSISFDGEKGEVGTSVDTLWNARMTNHSACHLKPSPDGKHLLFTEADYGTFPIWHREADLRLINLETGKIDSLNQVNGDYSDSYHSWSSNSRWFVFASKRQNGIYGQPYFCYIDKNGVAHKPFVLPQKNPDLYNITLKSYNIPELSLGPLPFDAMDIERLYWKQEAEPFSDKEI